jgi:hypothetical protein
MYDNAVENYTAVGTTVLQKKRRRFMGQRRERMLIVLRVSLAMTRQMRHAGQPSTAKTVEKSKAAVCGGDAPERQRRQPRTRTRTKDGDGTTTR